MVLKLQKKLLLTRLCKVDWGANIAKYALIIIMNSNLLPGVSDSNVPPRYYWPIPFEKR